MKKRSTLNEGMKFSNLPILEFRNHVSQQGRPFHKSLRLWVGSREPGNREIFLWIICRYLRLLPNRYIRSLKLLSFFCVFANKFFCFLTFNFYLLFFSPFRQHKNMLASTPFQLLRILPRNSTEGSSVARRKLEQYEKYSIKRNKKAIAFRYQNSFFHKFLTVCCEWKPMICEHFSFWK